MGRELFQQHPQATSLIARPIPAAEAAVRHKNERDIRVLGKRSDPGDFPVLNGISCFP